MPTIYVRWIWGFASDLEIIYPKCAHSLILTDQNWIFAPIFSKSTALESKCFGGNGAPK